MRCVVVESEHETAKKGSLFGKLFSLPGSLQSGGIDFEELLLIGLVFLLLTQRKERETAPSLKWEGIKELFGKMADNDLLILLLIYLLL